MTDTEAAVERFLRAYDDAMDEYDAGYVDADATLQVLDSQVDALREAIEE
ncbi:MAG: hypothetical protein V5A62_18890 [Haloarculaceae archaeon]